MVPQYEVTYPTTSPYQQQRAPTMTTSLPQGAVLTRGAYGQEFLQAPMQSSGLYQQNTNPQYRQVGSKQVTDTNVREAVAGDSVFDKQQKLINALQGQYDTRSKYASPSATGIQGLIAEPIVNQPQTGYNNINEIMRRYIG